MSAETESSRAGTWVLFATISASSMAFIGQSALNVALPTIQEDLGASGADLLWIVNAFQLLLGALILVGGSLGDHYGRKRVYMIGIVVFTLASVACGFAPTTEILIAARAVQGVGGALMVPGSLAIVSAFFDSKERGQAIGTWSAFTTMTSVLGPVLGGVLAEAGLWRMVFFINVPLAIGALYALVTHVPESRDEEAPEQLDIPGAVLVTLGLAGIVYSATEIGRVGLGGFQDPVLMGTLVGGILALVAFVFVELRSDHPLMSLTLFKSKTFSGANLLTLFLYGALGGALFFLPLNLVQVQGYRESLAGFAQLPFTVLLIVMSRWAGGLVETRGPRLPLIIGPTIVGFGFLGLGFVGITDGASDYWTTFFPWLVVFGFGMGLVVAPLTTSVMGSVPQHSSGVASGINNAISRSAGVLAVAVLGGVALVSFSGNLMSQADELALEGKAEKVLEVEAADLAAATPPDRLPKEQSIAVEEAVSTAFIDTFNLIMFIAAVMCWLSAGMAALLIEPKLKPPEELKHDPVLAPAPSGH